MITRNHHMSSLGETETERWANHRKYYAQFVDDAVKDRVLERIGAPLIKKYFELGGSGSEPAMALLPLRKWDALGLPVHTANKLKEYGEIFSMSSMVCINKEAARQLYEETGVRK
mgnify:CR=1 FL=1